MFIYKVLNNLNTNIYKVPDCQHGIKKCYISTKYLAKLKDQLRSVNCKRFN